MTHRKFKEGEIIVVQDKAQTVKEGGFNVAFFEKKIETKKDGYIVKEYISLYNNNDKYSKSIRPSEDQRFTNAQGDSFKKHDKDRYKNAYEAFLNIKKSLNKKKVAKKPIEKPVEKPVESNEEILTEK